MPEFFTEFWMVLKNIFLSDQIFYTRCGVINILVVFWATYVSNHLTRWKIVRWNLDNPDSAIFFNVKDTIWGFKVQVVPRPKEESATIKKTSEKNGGQP